MTHRGRFAKTVDTVDTPQPWTHRGHRGHRGHLVVMSTVDACPRSDAETRKCPRLPASNPESGLEGKDYLKSSLPVFFTISLLKGLSRRDGPLPTLRRTVDTSTVCPRLASTVRAA